MDKILQCILENLNLITITGRDAERMTAIKDMVRNLINACKTKTQGGETHDS